MFWITNTPRVQHELEVEQVELQARVAPTRRGAARGVEATAEVLVARVEAVERLLSAGDGRRAVRIRKDCIALELREHERGNEPLDDAVEQARDHRVRIRNGTVCERVVTVGVRDRLEE
jgi:hypothetical protein